MKLLCGAVSCFLALTLIQGCRGKEDIDGGKAQEEALIKNELTEIADANTQFPRTKDFQSILRFYSKNYEGIKNGKAESLKDIERPLSEVLERINLGAPIGIVSNLTNIGVSVTGPSGWASYEYEYKLGSGGAVLQTDQGKCTAIFRKQGDSWLIQHKHCSTIQGMTNLAQPRRTLDCPIIGDMKSRLFHAPGGRYYDQMQGSPDKRCFVDEFDARKHAYEPSQE